MNTVPPSDAKRLLLTFLFAAWLLAFAYAFVAYMTTSPTDIGLTRGLNRVTAFLGWQGVAGILAVAVFAIGNAWPRASGIRRLSRIPLGLALFQTAAIIAVILWARFG